MNVDDFVKYSDSVDDRMSEMARNLNESRGVTWSSWDHHKYFNHDGDSDSEEDSSLGIPKFSYRKSKTSERQNRAYEDGSDLISPECNDVPEKEFEDGIDSTREELLMSENSITGQNGVEELIRKFSVIEILRQKENLRKENVQEIPKLSPPKGNEKEFEETENNQEKVTPEAFFGWKKAAIKKENHKDDGESKESEEAHSEEEDNEIDEIVKMLSNSSLIKDYHDIVSFPNKDEEILKAFIDQSGDTEEKRIESASKQHQIDVSADNILGTEFKDILPSENVHSDDFTADWKADIARELTISFDGYEIDDERSFHDWMVFHQGI